MHASLAHRCARHCKPHVTTETHRLHTMGRKRAAKLAPVVEEDAENKPCNEQTETHASKVEQKPVSEAVHAIVDALEAQGTN